jgi:hypothetical protein
MWLQRGRRSWRLDGHKLDRQRDWLGVSNRHSTPLTLAALESRETGYRIRHHEVVVMGAAGIEPATPRV